MKGFYRFLLNLYPARFREEYAAQLEQQLRDDYRNIGSTPARAWFWVRVLADLAVSIPAELAREIGQDLRYGARTYRRRKFATALALAALALAIGASTGVFSVLNALLLRELPFPEPERLVEVVSGISTPLSGRDRFNAVRTGNPYLNDTGGYATNQMSLARTEGAMQVQGTITTQNFFDLLGVHARLGRTFAPDEDRAGNNSVAVLSYGLWQQAFGADPRVLGSTIRVNGTPLTVIGIAPPGFDYPAKTALWAPAIYEINKIPASVATLFSVFGRLRPGLTLQQAQALFEQDIRKRAPDMLKASKIGKFSAPRPTLVSIRDQLAGPVRSASLVLLGVVGFVLLIACANVAQLLLSRMGERRQELAVRAALGASRARLTQQLITEATLLTAVAAVTGLLVAQWASKLTASAQPAPLEVQSYTVLDWPVIAFALALAAITGLAFGVLPSIAMGRMQPAQDMVRAQTGGTSSRAARTRFALVMMQAGLTVMLVGGAITMVRSFQKIVEQALWYRPEGLVTVNVSITGSNYEQRKAGREYYDEALRRVRAIPGVRSAAAVNYVPTFQGMFGAAQYRTESGKETLARFNSATPDYFRTMGVELVAGRELADSDVGAAERSVVITEGVAGSEVLGQTLTTLFRPSMSRVVGIARGSDPQIYAPWTGPGLATLVAHVQGEPEDYLPVIRDVVRDVDRAIPVYDVKTMQRRVDESFAKQRFYTTATTFLAGFALLLAAIGVYGTTSYSVTQRTKEIGVRIAVGAPASQVRRLLARESLTPLALGLATGIGGALGLGRFLQNLLYAADPVGWAACSGAAAVLIAAGGIAVWRATARVVRIDPVQALRSE